MAGGFNISISIECESNPEGLPGEVVYDEETFPIVSQQAAADDEQGLYSSVRPFQFGHYENEDTYNDVDPPETDSSSLASHQEEEEEEDDCGHLQPSGIPINDMITVKCVRQAAEINCSFDFTLSVKGATAGTASGKKTQRPPTSPDHNDTVMDMEWESQVTMSNFWASNATPSTSSPVPMDEQ